MLGLGRTQWIIIVGSILVLGSGMGALLAMAPESAKMYLDFAGGFGWKAIAATAGGAGIAKIGSAIGGH